MGSQSKSFHPQLLLFISAEGWKHMNGRAVGIYDATWAPPHWSVYQWVFELTIVFLLHTRGLAAIQHPSSPAGLHPPTLTILCISFNLAFVQHFTSVLCTFKSLDSFLNHGWIHYPRFFSWLLEANPNVLPGIAEGKTLLMMFLNLFLWYKHWPWNNSCLLCELIFPHLEILNKLNNLAAH